MVLINHMVLQLWAVKEQKAWQSFGDWYLVLESPSFFCSSLSAHFRPSIPSLFNWLSVKVLLSASTCPCHSKQRQPVDTALSLFSPVSALFFPLPSSLTFFYFVSSWFPPLSPLPLSSPGISPFLCITPSFFLAQTFFFVCFSFILSLRPLNTYFLTCFFFFFLASWQTYIITVFLVYLPFYFFSFSICSQVSISVLLSS